MRLLDTTKTPEQLASRETVAPGCADFAAYAALVSDVFAMDANPPWCALATFDAAGRCVAGLQRAVLSLRVGEETLRCAAIRNVAVAEDWRGRGLATTLFARVLPWCDANADLGMLYAAAPALYARFGFAPLAQHAFEGAAPLPMGPATARPLAPRRTEETVARLMATRAPLSRKVFVAHDGGLTANALRGGDLPLFHDPALDAVIAAEVAGDVLVLVDVIAAVMPSAARILGALGVRPRRLRCLFPPDRLGWRGDPVIDDTGLMMRGPLPEALRRPFMLPPTVEF